MMIPLPLRGALSRRSGGATFQRNTGGAGSAEFTNGLDDGWSTAPGTVIPSFDGFNVTNGQMQITFTAAQGADPGISGGNTGLGCPRVETAISNADFDFYIKIDASIGYTANQFAGYSIIMRTGSGGSRHDIYFTGGIQASRSFVSTAGTTRSNALTNTGTPSFLRLARSGDDFTFYTSYDGENWDTIVSYTWAVTVTHIGFAGYQTGTISEATTFKVDYAHLVTHGLPEISGTPTRTTVLNDDFTDLSNFSDESATSGTASVSSNELTLDAAATDRSTGRVVSNATFAKNIGALFQAQNVDGGSAIFFGAVLRGNSLGATDWAGQYSPPLAYVFEGNATQAVVRLLRTEGEVASAVDGARFAYLAETNLSGSFFSAGWTNVRFECFEGAIRAKVWPDGESEPSAWTMEAIDEQLSSTGTFGLAVSKNDGTGGEGAMKFRDVQIYELS